MSSTVETYMHRCIELALLGAGRVAPNPMVGAVLVHGDRIIGEGYHRQYGQAHAEVNCIDSVADADRHLIPQATLFVSLEPCAHFGKTPPCSDLIIRHGIPRVVVGCRDPFPMVNGKGLDKLHQAGVETIVPVLEAECLALNKRFFTFVQQQRPYIILKWAQTADGKIAGADPAQRLKITNDLTNRLVHRWRSEEAAILVGTQTALHDDPSLTNRLWSGKHPVRLVLDRQLRLPADLALMNGEVRTIVFNMIREEEGHHVYFHKLPDTSSSIPQQIAEAAYRYGLQSILVEGGAQLLQSFIDARLWDEARIITNEKMTVEDGLSAPLLRHGHLLEQQEVGSDRVAYYAHSTL